MDVSVANWYANLDPNIQPAFNSTAMTTLTPSSIVFGAAVAYREAQETFNGGTSVGVGPYLNFTSPLLEDVNPSIDSSGSVGKSSSITLRARTTYTPAPIITPQRSITII